VKKSTEQNSTERSCPGCSYSHGSIIDLIVARLQRTPEASSKPSPAQSAHPSKTPKKRSTAMSLDKAFHDKYGPWALIAGGSEGIGKSFAEQLAAAGFNLILLARKDDVLQETAQEVRAKFGVEVDARSFDLTAPELELRIRDVMAERDIGLLVYNAGASSNSRPFLEQSLDYLSQLVRLNCNGPLILAHVVGNHLRARGRGGMIFLSSMGGFFGTAYVSAYAATKAFDMILAEGLWAELRSANIDVMTLIAGATDTPAMYRIDPGFTPGTNDSGNLDGGVPMLMSSDDVARDGLGYLGQGPSRVAGESNRAIAAAFAHVPREAMIEAMSGASAALFNKRWPNVYD
jgi:short-subunit dehydrogenase